MWAFLCGAGTIDPAAVTTADWKAALKTHTPSFDEADREALEDWLEASATHAADDATHAAGEEW